MRAHPIKHLWGLIVLLALGTTFPFSSLHSDLIFKNGNIKNQKSGPINFDTDNDGNTDIVMSQDGRIGIGTTSPKSSLDIVGSIGFLPQSVTSDVTLTSNTLILADTSSANITLTMPAASSYNGRVYQIKKLHDANDLVVTASTNIDKASSITLSTSINGLPYVNLFSNGTQWYIRSKSEE